MLIFTKAEWHLLQILDGTKRPGEIKEQTGLTDVECQDIYDHYVFLEDCRKRGYVYREPTPSSSDTDG